jgi:hypothetical protein
MNHGHPLLRAGLCSLLLCACTNIGPDTIARDRFDYSSSISDSWKRQTLLNIVKMRYMDPPIFVDVGQIVSGYTFETGVSASASTSGDPPGAAIGGFGGAIGGSARFTDRPTITYVPMTGNKFVRTLMTPLLPDSVFQTIPAGWPADGVLLAAVSTINGLDNMQWSPQGTRPPDTRFLRVLQLMREIQQTGGVAMRVKRGEAGASSTMMVIRNNPSPEVMAKGKELRGLLGLDDKAEEFTLAFGSLPQRNTEIAVTTRSVMHIMMALAMGVDVPDVDVQEGRAVPGLSRDDDIGRLIRIHAAGGTPADAFVSVRYRNLWFWIDDRDLLSKRTFAFMMMLFTLSDPGTNEPSPVITIPA